jgi:hypothetical protein
MRFILLAALAGVAAAQDAQLAALHATLVELRSQAPDSETMGASEKLTVAKHQLRDWIEGQLGALKDEEDIKEFAVRVNGALKTVSAGGSSGDQNLLGSIGEVQFDMKDFGFLAVTTGVGIICQYDESAYLYKSVDGRWQRVWEEEQNDYRKGKYRPQFSANVHIWQPWKDGHEDGPLFVLSLGHSWGCASAWHDVTYRVWRLDPARPRLLVDGAEGAWLRTGTYIVGSIGERQDEKAVDVLIEFTEGDIDVIVHNREAIRHFLIDGDRVTRVDPIALSPRDFVDEWLTRPWEEGLRWSGLPALQRWHSKLHTYFVFGQFGETMHCGTPDLWQVTFARSDAQKNWAELPDRYFLVRWRPPYHFTMVDISDTPWPRCTEKDPDADAWRTLFATQDWR